MRAITDSAEPLDGVIQASDGFFYGTTDGGTGTVFRLGSNGSYATINRFDGGDGFKPHFGVLQASDGFFYGTTPRGGLLDFQAGALFRLDAIGNLSVLHSFTQADTSAGIIPNSRLIEGTDGALYGAIGIGGVNGHGTIFRLDPRVPGPVASLGFRPASVVAGEAATGKVTLPSPAPPGGVLVEVRAASFEASVPGTVRVPGGATTATFQIHTSTLAATDIRVYASVGGQGVRAVLAVVPVSPLPHLASLTLAQPTVTGGQATTATVSLDGAAPAQGATVLLTSSSRKVVVPASVTIPGGQTSATFAVRTRRVRATRSASISAAYNGDRLSATLTILP